MCDERSRAIRYENSQSRGHSSSNVRRQRGPDFGIPTPQPTVVPTPESNAQGYIASPHAPPMAPQRPQGAHQAPFPVAFNPNYIAIEPLRMPAENDTGNSQLPPPSNVVYKTHRSHALADYQMQLALLENQNKKRLALARGEQGYFEGSLGSDSSSKRVKLAPTPSSQPHCPTEDSRHGRPPENGKPANSASSSSTLSPQSSSSTTQLPTSLDAVDHTVRNKRKSGEKNAQPAQGVPITSAPDDDDFDAFVNKDWWTIDDP